jgi:hypothetical protein
MFKFQILTEPSRCPTDANPFVSIFVDGIPPILETFYIVPSKLVAYEEIAISCISDIPVASILPTAFEALISKIKILLSVPTLIAKEPSDAIFIEWISP